MLVFKQLFTFFNHAVPLKWLTVANALAYYMSIYIMAFEKFYIEEQKRKSYMKRLKCFNYILKFVTITHSHYIHRDCSENIP